MDSAHTIANRLEAVFASILETRMKDIPILNPRLKVEAVGFGEWNDKWFGILITPWFINLMLLPKDDPPGDEWISVKLGESISHVLPAGRFDFILAREDAIGPFQMCSVFSPVLEFEDQEAARIAAKSALEAVMQADDAPTPRHDQIMGEIARGDFFPTNPIGKRYPDVGPVKVSRRQLLTGGASEEDGPG
jgi:[NiFe] hydrogenase assembly HybE family chaperone